MAACRTGMLLWVCVFCALVSCCFAGVSGDIPDDVVYTDMEKSVRIGESVVLKCKFRGTPLAVSWKKGDDPRKAPNLVSWIPGDPVTGLCEGERPCQIMEMTEDFSLIIKEVSIAEQGRYICRVASYKEIMIHNFTHISVFSPPHEPYPIIKQCTEEEPKNFTSAHTCSLTSESPINITCMAFGYFPKLELFFLYGSQKIEDVNSKEWINEDGTKNKSVSISGAASETPYICIASDIPGSKYQKNTSVIINLPSYPASTNGKANENTIIIIAVPVVVSVVAVVLVLVLVAYLWLRHQRESGGISDLEEAESMMQKRGLNDEVKMSLRKITSRHWRRLAKFFGITSEDMISKISNENYDMLFGIESMISEWMEGSDKKEKRKMDNILRSASRKDRKGHRTDFKLSEFVDEEHQRIASYLSSSQLKELFGVDSSDPEKVIRDYIKSSIEENPKQRFRDMLRQKLQPIGFPGIIPYKLESKVYLCELLDVAFRLLLEDVYPVAKALGISDEKLKKYRVDYGPDHLTKGTIAALIRFSETNDNDRRKVCEALSNAGYEQIALLLKYGHETSLADELAVASEVRNREEALEKISRNLGMKNRPANNDTTETLLRDWRTTVHPPSYSHRTSLADAVCPVLGADVAVSILSGQYRENGSESSAVIQRIIRGIESFEEPLIAKILGVTDLKMSPGQQVITYSDLTRQVEDRGPPDINEGPPIDASLSIFLEGDERGEVPTDVEKANQSALALRIGEVLGVTRGQYSSAQDTTIRQILETWEKKIWQKPLSEDDRRELSNNLLRAGFMEFSFEIMTGFVPGLLEESNNSPIDSCNQMAPVLRLWQQKISEVAGLKEE